LVDIGGGTTDITIFKDGIIRHTAVIPFGGNSLTSDIQQGCSVMHDQAEKLKIKYGSALADEIYDNRIITIPGFRGREHKEISEKNLARIIQARMEEIFNRVYWQIKRSGYEKKLIAGLVLTGGGSLLRHANLFVEYETGLSCRLGRPNEHLAHGYSSTLASPVYATGIGLLIHAINNIEMKEEVEEALANPDAWRDSVGSENLSDKKWYKRIFTLTKEIFETGPDTDF